MTTEPFAASAQGEIEATRRSYLRLQRWTLLSSAPAMFAFLLPSEGWSHALLLVRELGPEVVAGYLAMYGFAVLVAGRTLRDPREHVLRFGGLQVLVFLLGVIAAAAVNCVRHDVLDPWSLFVKPVLVLATFGSLPAFALGVGMAFGARVLQRALG